MAEWLDEDTERYLNEIEIHELIHWPNKCLIDCLLVVGCDSVILCIHSL